MVNKSNTDLTRDEKAIDVAYIHKNPDPELFVRFREQCGWGVVSIEAAEIAINRSLFFVCAEIENNVIGFGRVVGDGALNYYIQDMIVETQFRGRAIGSKILSKLVEWIKQDCCSEATIGLMAAVDREELYLRHGFNKRPDVKHGAGMTMVVEPTR